jgi:CRP/FNR family transcriptional regulator, cyclic AMP receptor protein
MNLANSVPPPDPFPAAADNRGHLACGKGNAVAQPLYTLIAQQPFFQGLTAHQLRVLTDSALEIPFAQGQMIFEEGSPANRYYLILEGKVGLETFLEERGPIPIQTLGPDDALGWAWLFPPYLLHLSARALTPTRTIFFYGTRLREQCEQDHDLGYQIMQRIAEVVVKQLQATQQRLLDCIVTNKSSPVIEP